MSLETNLSSVISPETLVVLAAVFKAILILLVTVAFAGLLSFIERRVLALWQDRYGPNRVGPFGIFQLVADIIKLFFIIGIIHGTRTRCCGICEICIFVIRFRMKDHQYIGDRHGLC